MQLDHSKDMCVPVSTCTTYNFNALVQTVGSCATGISVTTSHGSY
jgi:hypothetical protein